MHCGLTRPAELQLFAQAADTGSDPDGRIVPIAAMQFVLQSSKSPMQLAGIDRSVRRPRCSLDVGTQAEDVQTALSLRREREEVHRPGVSGPLPMQDVDGHRGRPVLQNVSGRTQTRGHGRDRCGIGAGGVLAGLADDVRRAPAGQHFAAAIEEQHDAPRIEHEHRQVGDGHPAQESAANAGGLWHA